MKKRISLLMILFLSIFLVSCGLPLTSKVIYNKKQIVSDKYGEVEYVVENIIVYKNLKDKFKDVEDIDYIDRNYGNRGSIDPIMKRNLYIIIDIVRVDDEYKLLVYNNVMRKAANVKRMYVLTDYFLPISVEDIDSYVNKHFDDQPLSNFYVSYIKKDSPSYNYISYDLNELSMAYYNNALEDEIFMAFTDYTTGNVIVGNRDKIICGNIMEEEIHYPEDINYKEYINDNYDTLNNEKVEFSLDKGESYQLTDNRLETFDLWNVDRNNEIPNHVFFYAFTYKEFIRKVDEAKNPDIYTYKYYSEERFEAFKEEYDGKYFEDNILIFYYKYEGNISENYVYSITKKDNTLTVNVNRFEGEAEALSGWIEVISIKRKDIPLVENIDLIVRTISPKRASVTAYIEKDYIRDFYINEKTLDDFKDLNNLKEIKLSRLSLNVDLQINKEISEEELKSLVNYLENNKNVLSTGYKGKDFIRVQMQYNFYDKVVNKTLTISDLISDQTLIDQYSLAINIFNFSKIASITFILEEPGKEYAKQMIKDLKELNYPFLNYEFIM